jgi:hypothetical protein
MMRNKIGKLAGKLPSSVSGTEVFLTLDFLL